MRTKIIISSIALVFIVTFSFVSCEKEAILEPLQQGKINNGQNQEEINEFAQQEINSDYSSVMLAFNVTPSIGTYTTNSTSNVTLKGSCGNYLGGVLRAKVISQSGSQFVVNISKQDNSNFTVSGTAKIFAGSICGTSAGSATYSSGVNSITITINATFAQGITHFYPVVESSGGKYFAEPFMVYTSPAYASAPYTNGTLLATVDGVNLYASSSTLVSSTSTYQCTDFCKRYYSQRYGLTIGGWGNANVWFNNTSGILTKYSNGSSAPRVGDVLCLSGGSGGFGHVAIITEVSANQIKMANQNGGTGTFYPIGWTLNRSVNTVSSPSGYTVQGWMRKP